MSLSNEGSGMVMPVGPMYGMGGNGVFGDNGFFWLLVIFVIAMMGNGFGFGGGFGNGGGAAYVNADVQRGFDQQAVMSGINGINAGINGLSQQICTGNAGIVAALNNGFSQAEIGANARQMADMQQNFAIQTGIAGLGYNIATEACADRQAVADLGTQLSTLIENKFNALQTQNYQERIADLERQLTMANLSASQTAQTAQLMADNAAQTQALEHYLNPTPIPAYPVANPNCCNTCGNRFMA